MQYDVLIVGTGLAGLNAAINLNTNLKIALITNDTLDKCNSYLAQGGITTVRGLEDKDTFIQDTLKAGQYANDLETVTLVADSAEIAIQKLIDLGVPFNRDETGNLKYTKEAAHSINRILYSDDSSGKAIWETLRDEVLKKSNIDIFENTSLVDLIVKDNSVKGAIAKKNSKTLTFYSKTVILACGGIGGVFKHSTNFENIKGIGISLALRYGIEVKDLGYIQIHPTAFHSTCERRKFLISESLRGEGATLIDEDGNRFVDELMPRDFVSDAILNYKKEKDIPCVLLDARHMGQDYLSNRFPKIYKYCLEQGIDMSVNPIPVSPCQHYFMGGIAVDSFGKSSMEGLFACGEVSCTGLHGKNRLASNSLLEATVYSDRVATYLNEHINDYILEEIPYTNSHLENMENENLDILIKAIKTEREDLSDELLDNR